MSEEPKSFTGRTRRRTVSPSVAVMDVAARLMISAGGIGTIVAVMGVCLFLVWVVIPLFESARVEDIHATGRSAGPTLLHQGIDEYRLLTWTLSDDGVVRVYRADDGQLRDEIKPFEKRKITDVSSLIGSDSMVFGFADGSVQIAKLGFKTRYVRPDDLDDSTRRALDASEPHVPVNFERGVIQSIQGGQLRADEFEFSAVATEPVFDGKILRLTHSSSAAGMVLGAVVEKDDVRTLNLVTVSESTSLFGGTKLEFETPQQIDLPQRESPVMFTGLAEAGVDLYVAWEDGYMARYRTLDPNNPFLAETGYLAEPGAKITSIGFVLGRITLVWGDSKGQVHGGFAVRSTEPIEAGLREVQLNKGSQYAFAITKTLSESGPPMLCMSASPRGRLILGGFDDGTMRLYNVTTEGLLATVSVPDGRPVERIVFAPKQDGLVAVTDQHQYTAHVDPLHPEVTPGAMFAPTWYEGYARPDHVWQSSSGSASFEPKYGLIPLVFGTIKATAYAMLFGAPIALLAAVYSSEFLHPRAKATIKPTIELMASLPSVVLGFLAALVFAPLVEKVVPTAMLSFVTVPFSFVFCAYLWQLLPPHISLRWAHWRIAFMLIPVVMGALMAVVCGPLVEKMLFAGDLKAWVAWGPEKTSSSQMIYQSAVGGWVLLLLPLCAIVMSLLINRTISQKMRHLSANITRTQLAFMDLGKFLGGTAATIALALGLGTMLNAAGFDPRASLMIWGIDFSPIDVYVQRNSLIVGFVMGFAVIPLIYTIADDALSAVPEHLRSASLGAGATPWQTAVRIIIPTALSGLFSALMIGLGRAVGETMIVLMAAGNTPILDMNLFAGFRTLSANIAVELPEAPKDETHYRTLFLAALVLFAMTFVVNTVAEVVRLRFRKRAFQL
ncbi:ABC transporter permease subunit [Planctomycetales bacterium ZRK34]|nr:ABC transporter permease subunit [Planctomycetales bacterium ZRK34]